MLATDTMDTAAQINRFANAIWEPDDIVEVRLIHRERGAKSTWRPASQILDGSEGWRNYAEKGYGVYGGVNPRINTNARGDAGVKLARCLFADLDHGTTVSDALSKVESAGLPHPTAVVSSGHGVHLYWRLTEPVTNLIEWRAAQKHIIGLLGSDKAIHNPERVMRLPGTMNVKRPGEHVPCELVHCEPERTHELSVFGQSGTEPTELDGDWTESVREHREEQSFAENTEAMSVCSVVSDPLCPALSKSDGPEVDAAIRATQPTEAGRRNRCIFDLARRLKSLFPDASPGELKPFVKRWFDMAEPVIETKAFYVTWSDFVTALRRVKHVVGSRPDEQALALADGDCLHAVASRYAEDDLITARLVNWCRQMELSSDGQPWFLSCRTVAKHLGISHGSANTLLNFLVADEVLSLVAKGNEYKANRYRYIAPDL